MYFETGTVPFKLSNKAKKVQSTEEKPEVQDKNPEIMDISEDDEDETPMFSDSAFSSLRASGGKAHIAEPSTSVPSTELAAQSESSTMGGDLDKELNRLNLEKE